jgi:hypothetical protein
MEIQYKIPCMNTGQRSELKYQWANFTHLSVGDSTQTWSKDAPGDHITMVWLAKICNGIKQ